MPITIKYDPDYQLVGRVAYTAGAGQAAERSQIRQEEIDQQAAQRQLQREQMAQQAALAAANDRQQLTMRQMEFDNAAKQAEQKNQFDLEAIKVHEDASVSGQERIYTFQQNQQRQKLLQAKQDWNNNPDIDLVTKQKGNRLLDYELNGINPQDLQKTSPWPDGQDVGQTWQDETGALLTRDVQGNIKLLQKSADHGGKFTAAEMVKIHADKAKLIADLMTSGDGMKFDDAKAKADDVYFALEHPNFDPNPKGAGDFVMSPATISKIVHSAKVNTDEYAANLAKKWPAAYVDRFKKAVSTGDDAVIAQVLAFFGEIQ
jgi:hypothetical protein